jgi:hypothetical protein
LDVNVSFDSATDSNKRQVFPDPNVPIATRKGKNNLNRNRMEEELSSSDEIEEQIPTAAESTVDSSGKSSFIILCF